MAIVYAAMAGRELIECRKKIKHGGWEKWVAANCEFTLMTVWRYMELAEKLQTQLANLSCTKDLEGHPNLTHVLDLNKLLARPNSELLPAEMETLLTDLREATKGQTLSQLYLDFGIASLPKPTGGANHLHGFLKQAYPDHPEYLTMPLDKLPKDVQAAWKKHLEDEDRLPEGETRAHFTAKDYWDRIMKSIHEDLSRQKFFAHLDLQELKTISEALLDAKRKIDDLIKKG